MLITNLSRGVRRMVSWSWPHLWTPGLSIPDCGREMQSPPGGKVRTLSLVRPGTILDTGHHFTVADSNSSM